MGLYLIDRSGNWLQCLESLVYDAVRIISLESLVLNFLDLF